MKNFNQKISSLISKLCALSLALLGFSCSSNSDDPDDYPCMYGTPTGNFEIKGSVTTEDNKNVENAEIRVVPSDYTSDMCSPSCITNTNQYGAYEISTSSTAFRSLKVVCLPQESNLQPDSVIIDIVYVKDPENKNPWYVGHGEETVNFKLKVKTQPE